MLYFFEVRGRAVAFLKSGRNDSLTSAISGYACLCTAVIATVLLLTACVSIAQADPVPVTYQVGAEDVLRVSVWKEPDLQLEVLVRPDGGFTLPLIGEVHAAGHTVNAIAADVTERLQKFITNPVVTVAVLKVGGNKIYVIGKVNKPGEFAAGRYVDVMQALSMAGGLTPFAANTKIKVLRRDGEGVTTAIPFNYDTMASGESLEQNIVLRDGDVLIVP